jgi:hypothetical protein
MVTFNLQKVTIGRQVLELSIEKLELPVRASFSNSTRTHNVVRLHGYRETGGLEVGSHTATGLRNSED